MMKTFPLCCVQLCVLVFCLAVCLAEPKEPKRSKFTSEYALTPSLRVGRRSDDWDSNTDVKRRIGKMVSFPRIGRNDPTYDEYAKRPGANAGMWFGPRLGRVQKRNGEESAPWTYIILNSEGVVPRQVHYTPRLGRESDEIYDDLEDNQA